MSNLSTYNIFYKSSSSDIVSSGNNNRHPYHIKEGTVLLNGHAIRIKKGDNLKSIATKINVYAHKTGIKAKVIEHNRGAKLQLTSSSKMIHIQDKNEILKGLYDKKLIGKSHKSLIHIKDAELVYSKSLRFNHFDSADKMRNLINVHHPLINPVLIQDLSEISEISEDEELSQDFDLISIDEEESQEILNIISEEDSDESSEEVAEPEVMTKTNGSLKKPVLQMVNVVAEDLNVGLQNINQINVQPKEVVQYNPQELLQKALVEKNQTINDVARVEVEEEVHTMLKDNEYLEDIVVDDEEESEEVLEEEVVKTNSGKGKEEISSEDDEEEIITISNSFNDEDPFEEVPDENNLKNYTFGLVDDVLKKIIVDSKMTQKKIVRQLYKDIYIISHNVLSGKFTAQEFQENKDILENKLFQILNSTKLGMSQNTLLFLKSMIRKLPLNINKLTL